MKSIQQAICLCASFIYAMRIRIGSERFDLSLLDNENEKSNTQALENFFGRVMFSVGAIFYILLFLMLSIVMGATADEQMIWGLFYLSILVHLLYQLYFTFYPIDKQELVGSGESVFTNLVLPHLIKNLKKLSPHQSNIFSFCMWVCVVIGCLYFHLYITAIMLSISLLSFGVIALNFFLVDTENRRKSYVGELRDKKLNAPNNGDQELLLSEKEKQKIIISKPL